jgi:hypothetical protein
MPMRSLCHMRMLRTETPIHHTKINVIPCMRPPITLGVADVVPIVTAGLV